ncbi:hypothetical protein DFAR_1150003 [Desulfarculales bacterium]
MSDNQARYVDRPQSEALRGPLGERAMQAKALGLSLTGHGLRLRLEKALPRDLETLEHDPGHQHSQMHAEVMLLNLAEILGIQLDLSGFQNHFYRYAAPRCRPAGPATPPPHPGQNYYQGDNGQAFARNGLDITHQGWRNFLGTNASTYLPKFARFAPGGCGVFVATWHWPPPGGSFTASYICGSNLYLVGMLILHLRWLVWIAAGIVANYIYFIEAKKQIRSLSLACH